MSFHWLSKKAETRLSSISGNGTYAKKAIRKGELIAVFGGHVLEMKKWRMLPKKIMHMGITINENLAIGAIEEDELGEGDFVNHSCDPNAGINGQIFLVAMRDIKANEEIVFDYAMVLSLNKFKIKCNCGSKNCRKEIRWDDWKDPLLQKKYDGYFSWYLQKKIARLGELKGNRPMEKR